MTKFTLDCEFDGFGGELISLALVRCFDNESIYVVFPPSKEVEEDGYTPWVKENVIPLLYKIPSPLPGTMFDFINNRFPNNHSYSKEQIPHIIGKFLTSGYDDRPTGVPYVIADWPDDIKYLCQALITGPGEMAAIPRIQFDVVRVNSYPNQIPGCVQHNAWWDAKALQVKLGLY